MEITQLEGKKILLAEDNPVNRMLACAILEKEGCIVTGAENGSQALDLAKSNDFDLVLMDIQMPSMDGLSAARRIRELDKPGIASIPILALTAGAPELDAAGIAASGMNGLVAKPFAPETLLSAVRRHLGLERKRAGKPKGKYTKKSRSKPPTVCLDTAEGIRRVGGNRALYRELLGRFVSEYGRSANCMLDAVISGDIGKAGRIAHSVKGIAGVLAANSLQDTARELETALSKNLETPHQAIERFRTELSAILAAAGTALQNPL